jgi:tetratricopeptide (TPR) repeat protein
MSKKELIIGIVIAVLLISWGVVRVVTRAPSEAEAVTGRTGGGTAVVPVGDDKSAMQKMRDKRAEEGREMARAAIAEHEEAMALDWSSPETPDRLMAVGNLYQYKLDEYDSAIQRYVTIVEEYPKHAQTPQAYLELAMCYERMGDEVQASYVYKDMLDRLDPAYVQHHAYAKKKLGEE